MTNDQITQSVANMLYAAAETRTVCNPVRSLIPNENSLERAYAIQELNTLRALADNRKLIGRKIGLTSLSVQKQLGVDQPDFGVLFEDMRVHDGAYVSISRLMQPKIEAEVALVMKTSLNNPKPSLKDLVQATDYACAAMEIVDSRIANWDIRLADTVADNASAGLFVLGMEKRSLKELDLVGCKMSMRWRESEMVSSGIGADCMGSPLNAALWLAGKMVEVGRPLQSGDCILTGALGPMVAVHSGDSFCASIEGLGHVTVHFE